MTVLVVPGQIRYRWCPRCQSHAGLEVGVYALTCDVPPRPPDLVGTFTGCTTCDPDLFKPAAEDEQADA